MQKPAATTLQDHPDFERIRLVALARGADATLASDIARFVLALGNVNAYLQGTHQGVAYGEHGCLWRSAACPLAAERPPQAAPAPARPQIDAGLVEAWNMLTSLDIPSILEPVGLTHRDWDAVNRTRITWGDLEGAYGVYIRDSHHVVIDRGRFQSAKPWILAALLAHELSHASIPQWHLSGSYNDCLWNEVLAFGTELVIGGALAERYGERPTPIRGYFRDLLAMTLIWVAQAEYSQRHGLGDLNWDKDLSDLPVLIAYLENERRYAEHCAR